MRVNTIILGAQKCATSTLFGALADSPEVTVSRVKEVDFFSMTGDWKSSVDQYHRYFDDESRIILEASPSYTVYPHRNLEIWNDIAEYNPETKLIYIVRPPFDRMVSAYRHRFERGFTTRTFDDFLLNDIWSIDTSRYAAQIQPFIQRFGAENVLLMQFDDIVRDQAASVARVCAFLGISADFIAAARSVHLNDSSTRRYHHRYDRPLIYRAMRRAWPAGFRAWATRRSPVLTGKPEAAPAVARGFLSMVAADIDRFEALSGWDLTSWRVPPVARR